MLEKEFIRSKLSFAKEKGKKNIWSKKYLAKKFVKKIGQNQNLLEIIF